MYSTPEKPCSVTESQSELWLVGKSRKRGIPSGINRPQLWPLGRHFDGFSRSNSILSRASIGPIRAIVRSVSRGSWGSSMTARRSLQPVVAVDISLASKKLVLRRISDRELAEWSYSQKDLLHSAVKDSEMLPDRPLVSSRSVTPDNPQRNHISRYLSLGAVFTGDGKGGGKQFCGPYYDHSVSHHHFPSWAQKKRFWMICSGVALVAVLGIIATPIAVVMERKGEDNREGAVHSSW